MALQKQAGAVRRQTKRKGYRATDCCLMRSALELRSAKVEAQSGWRWTAKVVDKCGLPATKGVWNQSRTSTLRLARPRMLGPCCPVEWRAWCAIERLLKRGYAVEFWAVVCVLRLAMVSVWLDESPSTFRDGGQVVRAEEGTVSRTSAWAIMIQTG
jgi:hypothetical protein